MKKFIVAVDSNNNIQTEAFLNYVKANNLGWWHWINNFWLIMDNSNIFTTKILHDYLMKAFPETRSIVIEIANGMKSWTGYGPSSSPQDMFEWIRNQWDKY